MMKLYEKYKEPILYVFFGALTTAVNYGSYVLLAYCAGMHVAASNGIAWIVSVLFAFVTNKMLVFESRSLKIRRVLREFISFVACRLLSGGLDMAIMLVFIEIARCNDLLVKLASNVIVVLLNYILSKMLIFTGKERAENG